VWSRRREELMTGTRAWRLRELAVRLKRSLLGNGSGKN
jgi:hypothetical protein